MKIHRTLLKFVSPEIPFDRRLAIARREDPETQSLPPADLITVLFVLSHDKDSAVGLAAKTSIEECPTEVVMGALQKKLDPAVLRSLYTMHRENGEMLAGIVSNPGADEALLYALARNGPLPVVEAFSSNRERLRAFPALLEGLEKNPCTPGEIFEKLKDFLTTCDDGSSQEKALREGPSPDPAPQEPCEETSIEDRPAGVEMTEEGFENEPFNILKIISRMTAAEKVKLALTGDKAARDILIKDRNRMISSAVLKNARITEQEIIRIASSKNISDEILREIAAKREWVKNYSVKLAMVFNSKTPLNNSLKLLDYIYDKDLKKLAQSKNIPGVLANAAQRKLNQKKRR